MQTRSRCGTDCWNRTEFLCSFAVLSIQLRRGWRCRTWTATLQCRTQADRRKTKGRTRGKVRGKSAPFRTVLKSPPFCPFWGNTDWLLYIFPYSLRRRNADVCCVKRGCSDKQKTIWLVYFANIIVLKKQGVCRKEFWIKLLTNMSYRAKRSEVECISRKRPFRLRLLIAVTWL